MGVGIGLLVSWGTKKITEAAQRVQNVATKSKEAADAAQSTTSSLKDLVSAYEELGDKSGWGTEDFDQAKDIQAEILDLAKEQGTLDENKLGKLDLQNGKYEEQLGLLQDITAEQLEASRYELTQNKDAQGDKLVDTAKKNNRTHYLTVWSAPEMDMGDQIKNAGIDIFNKFGGYGPDDLKDADSIVDYYNEVGKALKYVIDNTTEAERAAGGTYHSLYQFLLDEQTALRDDVDSYNDSTDAINNNTNARRELQAVDFWQNDNNNSMDVSFTFDKVNSAVQTLEDTIDGFDASKLNELLWGTNEGLSDEQAQALANLRKALTDMDFSADTNGVNAFIQALVQVGIVAQSSANDVDAVAQASQKMEDISSKIDEIQTAYKNATTAIEEYNKYGYLSADTLQTLLNEDFEYLSCLELVDGQLQVNTEKYQGMIAAQYQSAAMALVEKANAELAKIAQGEKKDAVEDATKATEDQATALTERVCPALGEFAKASMTAAAAQEFLANGDAAWSVDPERTKEVYAGLASGLDILDATVDQIMGNSDKFRQHMNGFDKETKNRNKNTAKSVTDVASAFDTLNKAMKEYNQYGCLCADTAKSLIGLDDKFTACLTKQGDMLQINVEQFRKFVKEQLKEANAAKDGGKSADEMNKILNYLDQNVDTTTISFEQLTDAIKGYGTAMDEAKEKTDAIKSAFSDLYSVGLNKQDNDFGFLDSDDIEKKFQAIRNLYGNTDLFTNQAYKDALNPETGEIDYNSDAFKQMFADYLAGLATTARETGGEAGEYLAQGFEDAAAKISQNVMSIREYIDGIGSSIERANNQIDGFQSAFSDIQDIVKEYNTYGGLSIDNYQKLMSLSDDQIKCLKLEGDQIKFDTQLYKKLFKLKIQAMIDEYDKADQTKALAQRLRELLAAVDKAGDGFTSAADKAKNFEATLSNIKSLLSDLIGVFEQFNTDKSNDLKIQGDAWLEVIDKRIDVYSSNIYGSSISYTKISRTRTTKTNATLVFGCAKADDGAYESYAKGTVYWSKLWYADLGDAACRELAAWTHDTLIVEVASFKNFYLSDNSNKRCSITFLQKDTLGQDMPLNSSSTNAGGWGNTSLREYLDSRLVDALPIGWKQLVKKVKVPSSAGGKSKEIVTSDCYFFIPSAIEVSSSMIEEPYIYEGQTISYLTGNESRIKHNANGEPTKYWLRSPFVNYDGYFYAIEETGELYGFHYPSESLGVTVEFSI